jgi:hypothetical protein
VASVVGANKYHLEFTHVSALFQVLCIYGETLLMVAMQSI